MSQLEDYELSIQHVEEAIKLNKSNNSSPYLISAEIYLKLRDFEKAKKYKQCNKHNKSKW